jgi:hypothetical protein
MGALAIELFVGNKPSPRLIQQELQTRILLIDPETREYDLAVASCRHGAYS